MMKNARTLAMGGCLAALGALSVVGMAMGQVPTPPDNCHCGPVDDCNGIPMRHSTYCPPGFACGCNGIKHPTQNCLVGLEAVCFVPATP